ncbi:MAG: DUF1338 domain-containing protein [Burkholderiales bacterium]|nr:DUF1338 domain-containing protein [Burkholderiales bacterium]
MSEHRANGVFRLVKGLLGTSAAGALFTQLEIDPRLIRPLTDTVSRAEMAQALNMALFYDLHERVPEGHDYVQDVMAAGQKITFDHGALRTVAWPSGALPPGEAAISRVLRPLGFVVADTYPLPRLKMTGRAWAHADFPETIAQFFVSELHPEAFSAGFQAAVTRVLADSVDPLGPQDIGRLERLGRDGTLPWTDALALLPKLVACFGRQHGGFAMADYETLLAESAEMAWIATEGNAFNHATDRVEDLQQLSDAQKRKGRSIKDAIEVSRSGRVLQTAFKAAQVEREFLSSEGDWVSRHVPGSFYEFIQRERLQCGRLDLAFDAGNATAIFKMTTHEALEILS